MELWLQLLVAAMLLFFLYKIYPSVGAMIEKGKNAEEKHWGSVALLAIVLVGFVLLMIYSVQ